jgi:CSLREA domain-containing protein
MSHFARTRRSRKALFEAMESRRYMAANTGLYFAPIPDQDIQATGTIAQTYTDLNNDGYVDMLRSTGIAPTALAVWMGNNDQEQGEQQPEGGSPGGLDGFNDPVYYPGGANSPKILAADVTGDGKLDVLHVNANEKSITVLRGIGDGTLALHGTVALGDLVPTDVSLVDWTRDGRLDLAITGYINTSPLQGVLATMIGNGDGSFGSRTLYPPADGTQFTQMFSVASGEFNGDTWPDLVVTHRVTQQGYGIFTNNGNGTFTRQPNVILIDFPGYVTTADFNRDGRSDFAFTCTPTQFGSSHPDHDVAIAINNGGSGAPTFTLSYWTLDTDVDYAGAMGIAVADMDGNGTQDVVFAGQETIASGRHYATVLRGDDAGNFTRGRKHQLSRNAADIAVPDVNKDGARDLMVTSNGSVVMSRSVASFTQIRWGMNPTAVYNGQPTFTNVSAVSNTNNSFPVASTTWYSYVVHAFFAGNDNHPSASGSMNYSITPAAPTVVVNVGFLHQYTGNPVVATATAQGVLGEPLGNASVQYFHASDTTFSNPLAGGPIDAGNYVARATFQGTGNYGNGVATAAFSIAPVRPTVAIQVERWTPFTGGPVPIATTVIGVNGANLGSATLTYFSASDPGLTNPLPAAPTAQGDYVVRAHYAGGGNYQSSSHTVAFFIVAAESLVVTTVTDELDANASPFFGSGTSLREAIRYANQRPGADTITFASQLAGQPILLAGAWSADAPTDALRIGSEMTIAGSGQTLTVAAGPDRRHILVESTGNATISGLTFNGGKADFGGAIRSFGSLTLRGCTFTGNSATQDAGAVHSASGSIALNIENCTFAGNSTTGFASAITTAAASNTWDHITIVDNTGGSAAIDVYEVPVTMRNSIVARNSVDGAVTSLGNGSGTFSPQSTNNIVGGTSWTGLNPAANQTNANVASLRLGTMAGNGGLTQTVALLPGSSAINAGVAIGGITTDQRGISRPQGFASDVGAYERSATNAQITASSFEFESRVALVLQFDADASVSFSRQSILLTNLSTGQPVAGDVGSLSFDETGTRATLLLTNLLPDGDYRMTAGAAVLDFTIFAGDANRDRTVNIGDFSILASRFNQPGTFSQGDFNYSGAVEIGDFSILASKFNTTLPAARGVVGRQLGAPVGVSRPFATDRLISSLESVEGIVEDVQARARELAAV